MILRDFLYLDEGKVEQYLSQVESGLRQSASRSSTSGKSGRGRVDAKVASVEIGAEREVGTEEHFIDTPQTRFDRLIAAVDGHQDEVGWVEVLSEADLDALQPRSLVELDVELGEVESLSMIGPGGALDSFGAMISLMSKLGAASGVNNVPSEDQIDSLRAIGKSLPGRILKAQALVGDTIVSGVLHPHGNPGVMEGDARLIGKVRKLVPDGSWEPVPGMPVLSSLPREQRRAYAAKGPSSADQEQFWIKGPAIEVDIVAIWN